MKALMIVVTAAWLVQAMPAAQAQAGAASQPAQATTSVPASASNGKAVFMAHQCWACHGYNGETGTRLLQEDGTFIARLLSAGSFTNYLRAPRPADPPPTGSSLTMPSYGSSSLSNQQAQDLFAYIKTFKPTQPALKDIPLLSRMAAEGGKLK